MKDWIILAVAVILCYFLPFIGGWQLSLGFALGYVASLMRS